MLEIATSDYAELTAPGAKLVPAIELLTPTPYYLTSWRRFTFQPPDASAPRTYYNDAIECGGINATLFGESPSVQVTLQNVSDPVTGAKLHWSTWLADNELSTVEVVFRWLLRRANGTMVQVKYSPRWVVGPLRIQKGKLVLLCGPRHHLLRKETPATVLKGARCAWVYKGPSCGSTSSHKKCGYTVADCLDRFPAGSPIRFSQSPDSQSDVRQRV